MVAVNTMFLCMFRVHLILLSLIGVHVIVLSWCGFMSSSHLLGFMLLLIEYRSTIIFSMIWPLEDSNSDSWKKVQCKWRCQRHQLVMQNIDFIETSCLWQAAGQCKVSGPHKHLPIHNNTIMEIFDGRYLTLNLCSISVQYHSCEHYIYPPLCQWLHCHVCECKTITAQLNFTLAQDALFYAILLGNSRPMCLSHGNTTQPSLRQALVLIHGLACSAGYWRVCDHKILQVSVIVQELQVFLLFLIPLFFGMWKCTWRTVWQPSLRCLCTHKVWLF